VTVSGTGITSTTLTTDTLAVNGGSSVCAGAANEQVLDFSGQMTPGHGAVTISVSAANYDFYYNDCMNDPSWAYLGYPLRYPGGCNYPNIRWKQVWKTHIVNGGLDVQINGSSPL
jgi:hypothetical protein